MARNQIMAGEFLHKPIKLTMRGKVVINNGIGDAIPLDKTTVKEYELITEDHRKSAISGVSRGLVGGALLGPVGLLAGLSAKNKTTRVLAIEYVNGKKSLIDIDEKIYSIFIQNMF
ncbi:hypothetical protein [Paucisalibacillus globulus]|uniref:hypothetical protein n=1 Tax=Paucisalibacillus globulus TaxID=351095 RepID=UPI000BB8603F|nr:hypothetical protein [Paucisalibacillus globulus]